MTPVNPPSVLGYRDTVLRNKTKAKVLREDVALLRRCDQMWIFTDLEQSQKGAWLIPEGALFELLFAKLFRPDIPVFIIRPQDLFAEDVTPQPFSLSDIDMLTDKRSIQELTDDLKTAVMQLPKVRYYYYDPLDFKYAEWVRGSAEIVDISPLDPMLSVRLLDGQQSLGNVGQSWLSLLRVADELCYISSLHEQDGSSLWCDFVESINSCCLKLPMTQTSWAALGVPKAVLGSKWPVTTREVEILLSRKRSAQQYA